MRVKFWWAIHNIVAHPLFELLSWLRLRKLGRAIHDYTVPTTRCETPGGVFHTTITETQVSVAVDVPFKLKLDEHQASELDRELHRMAEEVLSPYWIAAQ